MTDQRKLEKLFKQHYRQMYRQATILLHDDAESKDVVHDIFAHLLDDPKDLKEETAEHYLLTSVRNRCLNVIRSRQIQERVERLYLLDVDTSLNPSEGGKCLRAEDSDRPSSPLGRPGEVLLIDCFGLLSSIYHYADVAYVGGGFGVGIHNLLEAAVWDVPVFFGPNNQKFQEAQGLKKGGGFEISSYEDFAAQMDRFASDSDYLYAEGKKAGQFVKNLAGATDIVLSNIQL